MGSFPVPLQIAPRGIGDVGDGTRFNQLLTSDQTSSRQVRYADARDVAIERWAPLQLRLADDSQGLTTCSTSCIQYQTSDASNTSPRQVAPRTDPSVLTVQMYV